MNIILRKMYHCQSGEKIVEQTQKRSDSETGMYGPFSGCNKMCRYICYLYFSIFVYMCVILHGYESRVLSGISQSVIEFISENCFFLKRIPCIPEKIKILKSRGNAPQICGAPFYQSKRRTK